jgi:SAM-dependent methyltransferase
MTSQNLNLGCGYDIKQSDDEVSWTNFDQFPGKGVDIVGNINEPLPFPDNCFDLVFASHVLEHLTNYVGAIQEIYRVLKPGGTFVILVPEFPCRASVADPDHKRFFVPESFFHLTNHPMGVASEPRIYGLFELAWLASVPDYRPRLDNGNPGAYHTEIHAELIALKEAA